MTATATHPCDGACHAEHPADTIRVLRTPAGNLFLCRDCFAAEGATESWETLPTVERHYAVADWSSVETSVD